MKIEDLPPLSSLLSISHLLPLGIACKRIYKEIKSISCLKEIFFLIYDNFLHLGEICCCFQEEVFHEYILSSDE
jgi:hypothetical protein